MVETATFDQLKQEYGASEADDQADTVYYLRHPILFANAVDDDETNGLGPLPDFISLTINSVTCIASKIQNYEYFKNSWFRKYRHH